ncbi:Regulator of G-protein signaling 20 [Varanus komodoensis]|nr:Regulator of G-protein signaling 20 [Varanus komodoensis]
MQLSPHCLTSFPIFPLAANGIRANGDAQETDICIPGDPKFHPGTTWDRESRFQCLLLLLVLLLQLLLVGLSSSSKSSVGGNGQDGSLTVRNQDERAALHDIGSEPISNGDESSTPTVEEVKAWGKSFEKLMRSTSGRNIFREFLRTEFSEENMLFWLACEDLKKESSDRLIQEKAKRIYEDYVSILSPREVSLDSRARDLVNRNMLEPSQYSFDDAQLQIYTLMYRDSYPRFLSSTFYKNLIDSVSQKSAEA